MPVVTVNWLAGRTPEQKRAVAVEITEAVSRIGGTRPEDVWLVFNDVSPTDWAIGGMFPGDAPTAGGNETASAVKSR